MQSFRLLRGWSSQHFLFTPLHIKKKVGNFGEKPFVWELLLGGDTSKKRMQTFTRKTHHGGSPAPPRVPDLVCKISFRTFLVTSTVVHLIFIGGIFCRRRSTDTVPVRSWTRTLRRPGIRHRHLPCHAMPCQQFSGNLAPWPLEHAVLSVPLRSVQFSSAAQFSSVQTATQPGNCSPPPVTYRTG